MAIYNMKLPPESLMLSPTPEQLACLDDLLHSSEPDADLFAETFCLHQQIPPDCDYR